MFDNYNLKMNLISFKR